MSGLELSQDLALAIALGVTKMQIKLSITQRV